MPAPLPYPNMEASDAGLIALKHVKEIFSEKRTEQEIERFFVYRLEYKQYRDCKRMPKKEEMNETWGWYVEVLRRNDMSHSSIVFIENPESIARGRDFY